MHSLLSRQLDLGTATLLLLASAVGRAQTFGGPGAICAGTNGSTPAAQLLVGKHLHVREFIKPSIFEQRAGMTGTTNDQYTGFDTNLIDKLSKELDFTYSFGVFPARSGSDTWTDVVHAQTQLGDIVGGYWIPSAARRTLQGMELVCHTRRCARADRPSSGAHPGAGRCNATHELRSAR